MSVLVDSSLWIDYFRNGQNELLDRLITEDLVVTNDIVLSELIPALIMQNQLTLVDCLECLEKITLSIDWTLIRRYQILNLQKGINKVGVPDLLILQQVIESNLTLFSLDKHFDLSVSTWTLIALSRAFV